MTHKMWREGIYKLVLDVTCCQKCPLHKDMPFSPVPGTGPSKANIMLVGEALGEEESLLEEPFVGKCGKLLNKIIKDAGMDRLKLYITNTVKCRPTKNNGKCNRPPTNDEIESCLPWLIDEIKLVKPKCIITLGKVPTYTLLCDQLKKSFKLGDEVGVEYLFTHDTAKIFPCWHPSYLLQHGRDKIDETKNLFKELGKRYG